MTPSSISRPESIASWISSSYFGAGRGEFADQPHRYDFCTVDFDGFGGQQAHIPETLGEITARSAVAEVDVLRTLQVLVGEETHCRGLFMVVVAHQALAESAEVNPLGAVEWRHGLELAVFVDDRFVGHVLEGRILATTRKGMKRFVQMPS